MLTEADLRTDQCYSLQNKGPIGKYVKKIEKLNDGRGKLNMRSSPPFVRKYYEFTKGTFPSAALPILSAVTCAVGGRKSRKSSKGSKGSKGSKRKTHKRR